MTIDYILFIAIILLYITKFSAKKRLLGSVLLSGYCVYVGLHAHADGKTGIAVFLLIGGVLNTIVAYMWLGRAYPDKRLTDGKNDSI